MPVNNDIYALYAKKPLGYKVAKRVFDIASSACALVVLSPVMLAVAVAIVAEDGRPIIYAAPRKGKNGKQFSMYKFRSMCKDAEEMQHILVQQSEQGGAAFKLKNDPRTTRVGRFIRTYFLDEIPQFVNVLKGDMSLVGPRAIQQTRSYTPYEAQRLAVQPGLTCYWQTSGNMRMPWDQWVELDLAYIRDMSIWTDLRIIGKTFGVIIRGEGGY